MVDYKCCICGTDIGAFTTFYWTYQEHTLNLCRQCHTTIKQLKAGKKVEENIDYLRKKLSEGTVEPGAVVFVKNSLGEEPSEDEIQAAAKSFETVDLKNTSNGDGWLTIGGISFIILAVILYFLSVDNAYGVANIQATVFSAAAFVAGVVCFAAGRIIKAFKSR